jgi:hypothetical protein
MGEAPLGSILRLAIIWQQIITAIPVAHEGNPNRTTSMQLAPRT